MKIISIFLFLSLIPAVTNGQDPHDFGSLHLNYGTIFVYSTKLLTYESPDILKNNEILGINFNGGGGLWKASYSESSKGTMLNIGMSLTVGKGSHYLEHNSALNFHYGASLKGDYSLYIGTLYRAYLGYRFQPKEKHIILKIGSGWKEIIQIGIGWRF